MQDFYVIIDCKCTTLFVAFKNNSLSWGCCISCNVFSKISNSLFDILLEFYGHGPVAVKINVHTQEYMLFSSSHSHLSKFGFDLLYLTCVMTLSAMCEILLLSTYKMMVHCFPSILLFETHMYCMGSAYNPWSLGCLIKASTKVAPTTCSHTRP